MARTNHKHVFTPEMIQIAQEYAADLSKSKSDLADQIGFGGRPLNRLLEENGIEWRGHGSVHELYADELRELAKDPLISMEAAGKRMGLGASTINRAVKRLGIKWINAKPGGGEPRPRKPRSKPVMASAKHEVQPTKPANDCPEYTMGWDFNQMWRYTCPELELQGAVAGPDEMTARLNIEASLRKIATRRREHA